MSKIKKPIERENILKRMRIAALKAAFNTDSLKQFQTRIKNAEEMLIEFAKWDKHKMKKYSKSEVDSMKKEFKNRKQDPDDYKITFKNGLVEIGYSVSTGYADWYEVDTYTPFQFEQYLIWSKNK